MDILQRRKYCRGKRLYFVFLLAATVGLFFTFRAARTVDSGHNDRWKLRLATDKGFDDRIPLNKLSSSTRLSTSKKETSASGTAERFDAGRNAPLHPEIFNETFSQHTGRKRKQITQRILDRDAENKSKTFTSVTNPNENGKEMPEDIATNTSHMITGEKNNKPTVQANFADIFRKMAPGEAAKENESHALTFSERKTTETDNERRVSTSFGKHTARESTTRRTAHSSDRNTTVKDNEGPVSASHDMNATGNVKERLFSKPSDKSTEHGDSKRPVLTSSERIITVKGSERPATAVSVMNTSGNEIERPLPTSSNNDKVWKEERHVSNSSDNNKTEDSSESLTEATTYRNTAGKDSERPVLASSNKNFAGQNTANKNTAEKDELPVQTSSDKNAANEDSQHPVTTSLHGVPESAPVEETPSKRADNLRKVCKLYENTSNEKIPVTFSGLNTFIASMNKDTERNFFANEGHHLVYCAVQKVGSSFWKRAFRILNNKAPRGSLFSQSGLSSHIINTDLSFLGKSARWKRDMLKTSLKFIFVRHPFERTFSAYMDKIFLPYYITPLEEIEVTEISQGNDQIRQQTGQCRINVPTFAKFIVDSFSLGSRQYELLYKDPHFSPVHAHCQPCSANFDVVGKMESFQTDTEYILRKAGLTLNDLIGDDKDNFKGGSGEAETFDVRSDLNIMTDIAIRVLTSPAWTQLGQARCWATRDEMLRRMWTVYKVRGLLPTHQPYPFDGNGSLQWLKGNDTATTVIPALLPVIKEAYFNASAPEGSISSNYNQSSATTTRRSHNLHKQRMRQRDAAIAEAFQSVPPHALLKSAAFHKVDCDLFDYDCSLEAFLRYHNAPSNYSYFKEWM